MSFNAAINPRRRRHPGGRPHALHPRTARVTVRFSPSELADITDGADGLHLADVIRRAALGRRIAPRVLIPEPNAEAWRALARTAGNLNQLAHHANIGATVTTDLGPVLDRLRAEIQALRRSLIGLDTKEVPS